MRDYNKEILGHVISIKEDVAGIKEHLRQLNSKVATHEKEIHENKQVGDICHKEIEAKINKIDMAMAKWMGAAAVLVVVVNFIINKFLF